MLFQYYKPSFVLEQLRELSLPRSEYTSELTELSPPESFITEDEIARYASRVREFMPRPNRASREAVR
jgi:hypothetical protein